MMTRLPFSKHVMDGYDYFSIGRGMAGSHSSKDTHWRSYGGMGNGGKRLTVSPKWRFGVGFRGSSLKYYEPDRNMSLKKQRKLA